MKAIRNFAKGFIIYLSLVPILLLAIVLVAVILAWFLIALGPVAFMQAVDDMIVESGVRILGNEYTATLEGNRACFQRKAKP